MTQSPSLSRSAPGLLSSLSVNQLKNQTFFMLHGQEYEVVISERVNPECTGFYLVALGGKITISNTAQAVVFDSGTVEAYQGGIVYVYRQGNAIVSDRGSIAEVYEGGTATVYNAASGYAYNSGLIIAKNNGVAVAYGKGSKAKAYGELTYALSQEGAISEAYNGGIAEAYAGGVATAYDKQSTAVVYKGGTGYVYNGGKIISPAGLILKEIESGVFTTSD